ncbi:MAG: hypothetical protein HQK63_06205 [Desulfamplus sp.]|nr:hypothetical protein [Desulfamplus sp.]
MKVEEVKKLGLCKFCTLYQQIKKEESKCVAGRFPVLNYNNVKAGDCAFTNEEIRERVRQYGRN